MQNNPSPILIDIKIIKVDCLFKFGYWVWSFSNINSSSFTIEIKNDLSFNFSSTIYIDSNVTQSSNSSFIFY